ncbi:peptidase inhibitor family I36 protein [Allokutzneria oryzae]|uniref:Peptidase inhibitor family I36 protein n=1 Tax=Allokutzneria oryzae TaxID=1378989 RepID=A0ABV5ZU49_9PSEU
MRLFAVVLACALLGVTPAASAAPAAYDCPDNAVACLYDGADGTGASYAIYRCDQRVDLSRDWWDRVDSARNMKAGNITLWSYYANGGGRTELVLRAARGQYINAYAANMADVIDCRS